MRHQGIDPVGLPAPSDLGQPVGEGPGIVGGLAHVVEVVAQVDVEDDGVVFQGLIPEEEAFQILGEGNGRKAQVDHPDPAPVPGCVEPALQLGAQAVFRPGHGVGEGIAEGQYPVLPGGLLLGHHALVVVEEHVVQRIGRRVPGRMGIEVVLFVFAEDEIDDETDRDDLDGHEQKDGEDLARALHDDGSGTSAPAGSFLRKGWRRLSACAPRPRRRKRRRRPAAAPWPPGRCGPSGSRRRPCSRTRRRSRRARPRPGRGGIRRG